MLYRAFPLGDGADPEEQGGPLYVPRAFQGAGRHDSPDRFGVLYASRSPVSVVAEVVRALRLHRIARRDLVFEDRPLALASLDDPTELASRRLRPSTVATRKREVTQAQAVALYEQGHSAFAWWSTIEASWINVTLFADRAVPHLSMAGEPEPLTLDHPALMEAAEVVGVTIG
jgi:hypothetical protein